MYTPLAQKFPAAVALGNRPILHRSFWSTAPGEKKPYIPKKALRPVSPHMPSPERPKQDPRPNFNKVDLHVKLEGTLHPQTIFEIAKERYIPLPGDVQKADDLVPYVMACGRNVSFSPFPHITRFVRRLLEGSGSAIERAAYEAVRRQADGCVEYSELRVVPVKLSTKWFNQQDVVEAVLAGLRRGEEEFGVTVRAILHMPRDLPEVAEEVVDLAYAYRDKDDGSGGVVGVGLSEGLPRHHPSRLWKPVMRRARQLGLRRTVSVLGGDPESIFGALHSCLANRLGQPFTASQRKDVYRTLMDRRTHLEIAPTMGWMSGAFEIGPDVPDLFTKWHREQTNWSLTTHSPAFFNIDLGHEHRWLKHHLGLHDGDLATQTFSAARACFLDDLPKNRLLAVLGKRLEVEAPHKNAHPSFEQLTSISQYGVLKETKSTGFPGRAFR